MIEAGKKGRLSPLGTAMVVSLWVHLVALFFMQFAPPLHAIPEAPPLAVEIELPPPPEEKPVEEPKEAAKAPPEETAEKKTARKNEGQADALTGADLPLTDPDQGEIETAAKVEETISLESRAPEYLPYLVQVKTAIKDNWFFPEAARKNRISGSLSALFTVDRYGRLLAVAVTRSSGHRVLDDAAVAAVGSAAPFIPFPDHINLERLNIRANFDYRVRYVEVK